MVAMSASGYAEWTVVNLHHAGTSDSAALGALGSQQVGWTVVAGAYHAVLWSGSADSWIDLNPIGSSESVAWGGGTQQVGYAQLGGVQHASLWGGAAASWVDLHPVGSGRSNAAGTDGIQQVGFVQVGGAFHASLWSGTAASWIDLSPGGAHSEALGVDAGQQAGYAIVGGQYRASLWSGTAASWVDLTPAGASYSIAMSVGRGQQAGEAIIGGVRSAGFWTGSAASWVNLNPAGSSSSRARGVHGGHQVGEAEVGGSFHASLWSGTADSWVDLHQFLPAGFTRSFANGIWTDGPVLYVAGDGYNSLTGRNEALLWVLQPPGPVFNPANGHYYQRVDSSSIDWFSARTAAESTAHLGMQGHLATITSQSEQDFISMNLMQAGPPVDGHWIGAYQDTAAPDYSEPANGWRWITGETWSYANWGGGEPNNVGGNEHWALLRQPLNSTWNDLYAHGLNAANMGNGYIVEFEPQSLPLDTDNDGLSNADEGVYGTNPNDSDTDDDGLLDGTEVDMAQGTGCPNPLDSDSDNDGLLDGAEVALGTSPCSPDTDGDGVNDRLDPTPLVPGVPGSYIANELRNDSAAVLDLSLSQFVAPNSNAAAGRRNSISNKIAEAANKVDLGERYDAIEKLTELLRKLDGEPSPPDWMVNGPAKDALYSEIQLMIVLLLMP